MNHFRQLTQAQHSALTVITTTNTSVSLFSTTVWVSRYRKGETSLDLNEARVDGVLAWQWHQLDHKMQTI